MQARPYQQDLIDRTHSAWEAGARCVMPQLSTGGGKSLIIGKIADSHDGVGLAMAHRQELLGQLSMALARQGVRHAIHAPKPLLQATVRQHVDELGRSFYDPSARWHLAGVDTLVRSTEPWIARASMVLCDEGHHVLRANKWGKVIERINPRFALLPTATPERADGRGLGRHAEGLADVLLEGPPMRWLIDNGYLCDYRVICPPSDLDLSQVATSSATGDLNQVQLRRATHKSHLVGDVVEHYLKWAAGKRGLTFTVDVEEAVKTAAAFRAAGVPAEVLSGKTSDDMRVSIMRRLRRGEILQVVNCEVLGEGVDVPAVEVVSFARATQSYSLFAQQWGRALRPLEGKSHALIIDHVSNLVRHGGPPDKPRVWSLDGRQRGARGPSDAIPLRVCGNVMCLQPFERIHPRCPHCGWLPEPSARSAPEFVDGDLAELDPAVLAAMRGEVDKVDSPAPVIRYGATPAEVGRRHRDHWERQQAQAQLRHAMGTWAATHAGETTAQRERRFYFRFGVDRLSAMALSAREAAALREKIEARLLIDGYVISWQDAPCHPPTTTEEQTL